MKLYLILLVALLLGCKSYKPTTVHPADPHPERTNQGVLWQQAIPYVSDTSTGGIVGDTNMLRVIQLLYWDEPVRQ